MNWEECKKRGIVKEVKSSEKKIYSLFEISKDKLYTQELLPFETKTASSKAGLVYDALRIVLEALALNKGYKIYNHDCIACFLKEKCGEDKAARVFDKYRIIRNGFNYYGEDISIGDAERMVEELKSLRKNILVKYFGGDK